jgi:hypothetical protein
MDKTTQKYLSKHLSTIFEAIFLSTKGVGHSGALEKL